MVDFHDDLRDLISNGKYAHPIVSGVPAWTADNGEMVFYSSLQGTTDRRIYVRLDSSWVVFAQLIGTGSGPPGVPGGIESSIQYNSGGAFGGDPHFLWNASVRTITVAGSNAANYLNMYDTNSNNVMVIDSNRSTRIGQFATTNGFDMLALGITNHPTPQTDSVSLYGKDEDDSSTRCGLWIMPEGGVGGPHYIGNTVVFSGNSVTVQNDNGAGTLNLKGGDDGSTAGQLVFKTQSFTKETISFDNTSAFPWNVATPPVTHARLACRIALSTTPTYILFERASNASTSPYTVESPITIYAATTLNLASNTQLINQRFHYIESSIITGSATGTISSISNATTVFIEGPPVALNSSMTLLNSYALWIAKGPVRIDGQLITGANTTVTKNGVFFTTTAIGVSSNNASDTTLIRGVIGTTSLVANTFSDGRSIRLQARGYYNTAASAPSLRWNVKLGGTTVLTTGSLQTVASVSTGMFDLTSLITCWTTGGAGTVYAQGHVLMGTAGLDGQQWAMTNSGTTVINTTGANVVEITVQWGSGAPQNEVTMTHCVGELLN